MHRLERFYKWVTIGGSLVCILFFGLAAYEELALREWKSYRLEFKEKLRAAAKTDAQIEAAEDFPIAIQQNLLPELGRVDRCITCHGGLENPSMADADLPHRAHSGDYLLHHPIEKFGCTVCHGGQGRALSRRQAFARSPGIHWDYPVLPMAYAQLSCGKCHMAVFDPQQELPGADVLARGKKLFLENGCLGCHVVRGTGGTLGPELTRQGLKTKHEYDFTHVEGERTERTWLREHFVAPERVSPGSKMPALDLDEDDLTALISFTMALTGLEFPALYQSLDSIAEFKGKRRPMDGALAYAALCSSCHGAAGEGRELRQFEEATPPLHSPDFLAVASPQMLKLTVRNGRSGRLMPAWTAEQAGLTEAELDGLVEYVRSWRPVAPSYAATAAVDGDEELGRRLYPSRCGICHGPDGKGGIGPSLNNQDFLAVASDKFLFRTMVDGRENTAMPSWSGLSAREVAGLLTLMRSWQTVPAALPSFELNKGDAEEGESMFAGMCAGCHGKHGQGAVGPALLNRDFLAAASDGYIRETIYRGRRDTAMVSWGKRLQGLEQLHDHEIGDLVAFIRSREHHEPEVLHTNITPGTPSLGKDLYAGMCAGCHGVDGEGEHGPALNNPEFLDAATNGFLQATIAMGRQGTAMRSWAKGAQGYEELSAEQINDIVAYVRTWHHPVSSGPGPN